MRVNRKTVWIVAVLLLTAVFLAYYAYGRPIGNMVKDIMESAFASYTAVVDNPYAEIISDEYYNYLIHRKHHDFSLPGAHDYYKLSAPAVRWWPGGAQVSITYTYAYYVGDEIQSASFNIPVDFTLEHQNGQWKIVDYHEAP